MLRICIIILTTILHASFLHAAEPKFKFIFGSNLGGFPLEINKMNKDKNKKPGIKINSWSFLPNLSTLVGYNELSKFSENKISKDSIYIKFNLTF